MQMAGKINNVIADMKKYKPDYYLEFQKDFDALENFRLVRNDMSHCKCDFPNEPNLDIFRIFFVDTTDTGGEAIKYRDYTEEFINESVNEFHLINRNLSVLWMRLSDEFGSQNQPFAHPSTGY
jgi:hypothetical protein